MMLTFIANHLWQSTLFAGAAALVALLLRNDGAHVRYWLWLAASVNFLVPFSLLAAVGAAFGASAPADGALVEWYAAVERVAEPIGAAASAAGLLTALALVWASGAAAVLAYRLRQHAALHALLRSASPGEVAGVDSGTPLPVRYANAPVEPSLIGVRKPVMLLPRGIEQRLDRRQLDAVVAHELCHLRRRDNLTALLHMSVEVLFWFHPLVWWIGARLVEERERACDEAVLGAGHDGGAYAEGLLNVCELYVAQSVPHAAGVSGGDLKARVVAIMTSRTFGKLHPGKKLVLAALGASALFVPLVAGFVGQGTGGAAFAQEEEEVMLPIVRVAPVYPQEALEQRLEGEVLVQFTVTTRGTIEDLVVVRSSHEIFERSALDAAAKFRYRPRIENGTAVEVPGVLNLFTFVLEAPDAQSDRESGRIRVDSPPPARADN